jgi:flagellin-like hook-associated protein FlgL
MSLLKYCPCPYDKLYPQLFTSNNNVNTAVERLSSGFRINSAKDDAARW